MTIPRQYNFDEAMALMKQGERMLLRNTMRSAIVGDCIRPSYRYKVIYCGHAYSQKCFRDLFGPGAKYENKVFYKTDEYTEWLGPEALARLWPECVKDSAWKFIQRKKFL